MFYESQDHNIYAFESGIRERVFSVELSQRN